MMAFGIGAIIAGILAGKEVGDKDYSAGVSTGLILGAAVAGGLCVDAGADLIGFGREEAKERREWKRMREYVYGGEKRW